MLSSTSNRGSVVLNYLLAGAELRKLGLNLTFRLLLRLECQSRRELGPGQAEIETRKWLSGRGHVGTNIHILSRMIAGHPMAQI